MTKKIMQLLSLYIFICGSVFSVSSYGQAFMTLEACQERAKSASQETKYEFYCEKGIEKDAMFVAVLRANEKFTWFSPLRMNLRNTQMKLCNENVVKGGIASNDFKYVYANAEIVITQKICNGEDIEYPDKNNFGISRRALNELIAAANSGNVDDIIMVGNLYSKDTFMLGRAIPKRDFSEASKWFNLAANKNSPEAFFMLGEIYRIGGYGVDKDFEKSKNYYEKASKLGLTKANEGLRKLNISDTSLSGVQSNSVIQAPAQQKVVDTSISMEQARAKCLELGFKAGTESYGQCILKVAK